MALNLVRNSKVFFTTNVNATTGIITQDTAFTAANTTEIQVLDGFTFSQNTNQDTVTISEAGTAPVRGQRAFNTSLAPVDFSFSNYVRPYKASATLITAEESVLWNALLSDADISTANTQAAGGSPTAAYTYANGIGTITFSGMSLTAAYTVGTTIVIGGLTASVSAESTYFNAAAIVTEVTALTGMKVELVNVKVGITSTLTATAGNTKFYKSAWAPVDNAYSLVTAGGSNKNQLQKFGLLFLVDQVLYAVDNCALNQVSIDFGLDAIATAAWTGQATQVRRIAEGATAINGTFGANSVAVGAGTVGTPTGSGSAWAVPYTLTTAAPLSLVVGSPVSSVGTGQLGTGAKITSITYNAAGSVSSFTVASTTTATAGAATSATALSFANSSVYTAKVTAASYITNKLSTVTLTTLNALVNSAGFTVSPNGTAYAIALTGGSITINNNISYITPANLGVVNIPVTYYTGTRAITGTLNAYLKTGAGAASTGQLLSDLLDSANATVEPMFALSINIGGALNTLNRVVMEMPSVTLTLPSMDVQQVVSTSINFTAQGSSPTSATAGVYDLAEANDISVRYYGV